ncbi:hypothetical protein RI367_003583 [Sorochytrium milnesiophthora]
MKSTLSITLVTALLLAAMVNAAPTAAVQPKRYIVRLKPNVELGGHINKLQSTVLHESATDHVRKQFTIADFVAYSGQFSDATVAKLKSHPEVQYVVEDMPVRALGVQNNPPSWGLSRISTHDLDLSAPFRYPTSAGSGVTIFGIDTGIDIHNKEFGGRAKWGTTTCDGCGNADGNGHGSHTAGTFAGATYGVAKKANVVAVKVLGDDGSGTNEGVIAGMNWVAQQTAKLPNKRSVANMSLGGGQNQAMDDAAAALVKAGCILAVAAGNDGADACNTSPAASPSAITVGATDNTDSIADFSNYGQCVDVLAPGVQITSIWLNGGTNTIDGTSMATPHVAGVAALLLAKNPKATPAQISKLIQSTATSGDIQNLPDDQTPNLLLFAPPN